MAQAQQQQFDSYVKDGGCHAQRPGGHQIASAKIAARQRRDHPGRVRRAEEEGARRLAQAASAAGGVRVAGRIVSTASGARPDRGRACRRRGTGPTRARREVAAAVPARGEPAEPEIRGPRAEQLLVSGTICSA